MEERNTSTGEGDQICTTMNDAVVSKAVHDEKSCTDYDSVLKLPEVALRWIILSTASNVELAQLSNVSQAWRRLVQKVLLEVVQGPELDAGCSYCGVSSLLLPSMMARILELNENDKETFCVAWFAPEGIQTLDIDEQAATAASTETVVETSEPTPSSEQQQPQPTTATSTTADPLLYTTNAGNDTVLTAELTTLITSPNPPEPFAPSGSTCPLYSAHSDGEDRRSTRSKNSFISRRLLSGGGFGTALALSTTNGTKSSNKKSTDRTLLCPEWRGYRHAWQVLRHFGYSKSFLNDLLLETENVAKSTKKTAIITANMSTTTIANEEEQLQEDYTSPTFAVRGVTVARPDGYCCCMDESNHNQNSASISNHSANSSFGAIAAKRELQRQVLPRILQRSTLTITEKDADEARAQLTPPSSTTTVTELSQPQERWKRQPRLLDAVQFLNASGSHAVCMVTPPLTQPLGEPLTVILVGIATEDGCFVSGLKSRMEVGHLYPLRRSAAATINNDNNNNDDHHGCCNCSTQETLDCGWSPICLATVNSNWHCDHPTIAGTTTATTTTGTASTHLPYRFSSDDDYDDDSSVYGDDDNNTRCQSGSQGDYRDNNKCRCIFAPVGNKLDRYDDEDDDDDDSDPLQTCRIHRGRTGPGMWRCYTAIFDGLEHSKIRVDGLDEQCSLSMPRQQKRLHSQQSHHQTRSRIVEQQDQQQASMAQPILDGLTIGSDHCFGMSLCCGYGSGGEGEGAIAELVVVKGRLAEEDLLVLEHALMERHGIPIPALDKSRGQDERLQENEWIRRSHALYYADVDDQHCHHRQALLSHVPCEKHSQKDTMIRGVPLRIMARHRAVAWRQQHPVTGRELRIPKIGNRPDEAWSSASDW